MFRTAGADFIKAPGNKFIPNSKPDICEQTYPCLTVNISFAILEETIYEYSDYVATSNAKIAASHAQLQATIKQSAAEDTAVVSVDKVTGSVGKSTAAVTASGKAKVSATGKTKKLTEAEKEAKKAAEDLARANEGIEAKFTAQAQAAEVLALKLQGNEAAARQLELRQESLHEGTMLLSAARAAELQQMEAANDATKKLIQNRLDEAAAVKKAKEAELASSETLSIAQQAMY